MKKKDTVVSSKTTIPVIPQYRYEIPVSPFAAYGIFPPLRCQAGAYVADLFPTPLPGFFHPYIYVCGGCSVDGTAQDCQGYFLDIREPRWVELTPKFRKKFLADSEKAARERLKHVFTHSLSQLDAKITPATSHSHPLAIAGMVHVEFLPSPRYYHTVTNANGFIWVIGGWDGIHALPDIFALDPQTLEWFAHPSSPQYRAATASKRDEIDFTSLIQKAAQQVSSVDEIKSYAASQNNELPPYQYHNTIAFGPKKQYLLIYGSWGVPVSKQLLIFNTGLLIFSIILYHFYFFNCSSLYQIHREL